MGPTRVIKSKLPTGGPSLATSHFAPRGLQAITKGRKDCKYNNNHDVLTIPGLPPSGFMFVLHHICDPQRYYAKFTRHLCSK